MTESLFLQTIVDRIQNEAPRLFVEVWIGTDRHRLTWGDLGLRAQGFADAYRERGIGAGDVVFLMLKHSPDLYPAFLGAMLIGAAPSNLPFPNAKQDPELFWRSQVAVFERTRSRLLVTYRDLAAEVGGRIGAGVSVLACEEVATPAQFSPGPLPSEDQVALLQHSSGTTGLKKGVMLSHRAIRQQIVAYGAALELDRGQPAIASWLPLYHDMGLVACFLLPMFLGIPLVSLDPFEWTPRPAILLEAIESCRATHVWLPNFALAHTTRATSRSRRFDLSSVKAIIGCSEPNKPATYDQFVRRFADEGIAEGALMTCYAMAETVFAVAQSAIGQPPRRVRGRLNEGAVQIGDAAGAQDFLSNGRPISGMEVKVLKDGVLQGAGVAGELCVRAPYLFSGYFGDPDLTGAAFIDGFFRTGDLGFVYDGEVYIFGRIKELIIVNGRNFFAHDLEAAASDADGVKKGRCVAFGVYAPTAGSEQIVVIAERDEPTLADHLVISSIARSLNLRFGTTAGDIRVVEPGWLVKTTSGKMSRAENARKYQSTLRPEAQILATSEDPS